MRFVLACLLWIAAAPAAHAMESGWAWLESYRLLAPRCPAEAQAALSGLSLADLGEAIEIFREREAAVTARVRTGGDIGAARRVLDEYRAVMTQQLDVGVTTMGCLATIRRLDLDLFKLKTKAELLAMARSMPIPSTERTDAIPVADRIGTLAAYDLQKMVTAALDKDRRCDLASLKVTPLKETIIDAADAPPFVGQMKIHEERWQIVCGGVAQSHLVTFRQDARKWRSYKITMEARRSA